MLTFTILSLVLLVAFTVWAARLAGEIPTSYSALGTFMADYYPGAALNPWSIVTFVAAFLMVPPMVDAGDGSLWQCLGFFAPLYLIVVALTPDWEKDKKQRIIHRVCSGICALLALLWLIIVREDFGLTFCLFIASMVAACASRTIERSAVFWLEVGMFASVYASLMIGG